MAAPASARDRLLEAGYACVARYGLVKTTVDDVAREARLSRATVYRHFPGGKDQLVRDVITWEINRFFSRLAAAVEGAPDFASLLEEALVFAHQAIEDHAVLQKILETEPDRLLPQLTVESRRLIDLIKLFLSPYLATEPIPEGLSVDDVAEHIARLMLSFIAAQGRWDLTDRAQVSELVTTELLAWRR